MAEKKSISEEQVLETLGIPDFRHMTKDRVVEFMSLLPDMDPEVAKAAFAQFPEFSGIVKEVLKTLSETTKNAIDNNNNSVQKYYAINESISNALLKQLEKDNLSEGERHYIIDQVMEISNRVGAKDTDNKNYLLEIFGIVGGVLLVITLAAASLLGGKGEVKIPKLKS